MHAYLHARMHTCIVCVNMYYICIIRTRHICRHVPSYLYTNICSPLVLYPQHPPLEILPTSLRILPPITCILIFSYPIRHFYKIKYRLPQCYYISPPALKTAFFQKFTDMTLFYIFYHFLTRPTDQPHQQVSHRQIQTGYADVIFYICIRTLGEK